MCRSGNDKAKGKFKRQGSRLSGALRRQRETNGRKCAYYPRNSRQIFIWSNTMKRSLSLLMIAALAVPLAVTAQNDMKPPVAKKVPKVLKIHDYEITDEYGWLRDRNEKKNPEIVKYLEAENAYTEAHMGKHQ